MTKLSISAQVRIDSLAAEIDYLYERLINEYEWNGIAAKEVVVSYFQGGHK